MTERTYLPKAMRKSWLVRFVVTVWPVIVFGTMLLLSTSVLAQKRSPLSDDVEFIGFEGPIEGDFPNHYESPFGPASDETPIAPKNKDVVDDDEFDQSTVADFAPLLDYSSIPAGIVFGSTGPIVWNWDVLPANLSKPKLPRLEVMHSGCKISIISKNFLISSLKVLESTLVLQNDAVAPRTILKIDKPETAYITITSDLTVSLMSRESGGCTFLRGKRQALGTISLDDTTISLPGGGDVAIGKLPDVEPIAKKVAVFLVWPKSSPQPLLRDEGGAAVSVTTSIIFLRANSDGKYFIEPHLKLTIER